MTEARAPVEPPLQARSGFAPLGRATKGILVVLWACFLVELLAAKSFSPEAPLLAAMGGIFKNGLEHGGTYRFLTASLLHANFIHILFNSLALVSSGRILESRVGASATLVVFTATAIAGAFASVLLNDARVVSVGASGAVMGVAAAAACVSFHMPKGEQRGAFQRYLAQALVFNLLPIASMARDGGKVDYGAHLGGAVGGAVLGLVFLAIQRRGPQDDPAPPLGKVGTPLAGLSIVLYVVAVVSAAVAFPGLAESATLKASDVLVPDDAIPKENREGTVETWGKDKPRDPRVHLYRAVAAMDRADDDAAEKELRAALQEKAIFEAFFGNGGMEGRIRNALVEILLESGRTEEAEKVAQPACATKEGTEELLPIGYCKGGAPAPPSQSALLTRRCRAALQKKQDAPARALCRRASEAAGAPEDVADAFDAMAEIEARAQNFAASETSMRKALEAWRRTLSATPSKDELRETGRREYNLALVLGNLGKQGDAEVFDLAAIDHYDRAGYKEGADKARAHLESMRR